MFFGNDDSGGKAPKSPTSPKSPKSPKCPKSPSEISLADMVELVKEGHTTTAIHHGGALLQQPSSSTIASTTATNTNITSTTTSLNNTNNTNNNTNNAHKVTILDNPSVVSGKTTSTISPILHHHEHHHFHSGVGGGSKPNITSTTLSVGFSDFDDDNYKMLKSVKLTMDLQYLEKKRRKRNLFEKKYIWVLLTIASVFGGVVAYIHDLILRYMFQGRITIVEQIDSSLFGLRLFVWIVFNLFFIGITLLMVVLIAPAAEGSGVSHIKAVLNGATLKDAMSLQTFFVKLITIAMVVGSQMMLGKLGPTIHMCTIFILYMMKLKIFQPIAKSKRLRQQLILCGVSIGVGAVFSAPCGGVLFAIELVGGYYSMRTYFKAFYVATVSALVSRMLNSIITLNMDFETFWDIRIMNPAFTSFEMVFFILLGILVGVMGIVFVQINIFLMKLKDKYGSLIMWSDLSTYTTKYRFLKIFENKILMALLFSVLTSVLSYPDLMGKYNSLSFGNMFKDLMSTKPLSAENNWITNSPLDVFQSLFILLLVKFFLIIFTIILPIPGGSYNGIILLGTIVGRIMGEIINVLVPNGFPFLFGIDDPTKQHLVQPGAYAFVGGVASAAAVTQSYSVVVMFLEMAGTGAHIPSLVASVIALSITKYFSLGMYNVVINLRGWNVMLENETDSDDLKLVTIMKPFDEIDVVLEEEVSFDMMEFILEKWKLDGSKSSSTTTTDSTITSIPIVNNRRDMILLGKVTKDSLIQQYKRKKAIVENNELPSELQLVNSQSTTSLIDHHHYHEQHNEQYLLIDYQSCDVVLSENNDVHLAHQILYQNTDLDALFVCWKGKLLGMVERGAVKDAILSKKQKKEMDIYHLY